MIKLTSTTYNCFVFEYHFLSLFILLYSNLFKYLLAFQFNLYFIKNIFSEV